MRSRVSVVSRNGVTMTVISMPYGAGVVSATCSACGAVEVGPVPIVSFNQWVEGAPVVRALFMVPEGLRQVMEHGRHDACEEAR